MDSTHDLHTDVEYPAKGIAVVRIAGEVNHQSAALVCRVLDEQLDHCLAVDRSTPPTVDGHAHLVVELAEVRCAGMLMHVLRQAQHAAEEAGIEMHLTGDTPEPEDLPRWAVDLAGRSGRFPRRDATVRALTAT